MKILIVQTKQILTWSITILIALSVSVAKADEISYELADHFLNKTAAPDLIGNIKLSEAMKIQGQYVSLIKKEYGAGIGYKAGLTNTSVQEKFGVSHPLRGTLLKKMLLKNGSEIDANFGVNPLYEGDIVVRVKDDLINQAKTKEEAIKSIDAVMPFIELPDIIYSKEVKLNGPALAAINVGARYGIIGEAILVESSSEWIQRLKNFDLKIMDEKGNILAEGKGSNLLDHPLNVVLWIRNSLAEDGKRLKKGDLLSLGTITKLMPAKKETIIRAVYTGLDPNGPIDLYVKFK